MAELFSDAYFMELALREAEKAAAEGEVPVGAIVVCNNKIIGKGHNLTERLNDVTAHAEMQAITAAANYLGAKYLTDCTLYVSLEPCIMCAGAIYWSQVSRLVYGASDAKRGFMREGSHLLHPKTEVSSGILADKASQLVKDFFKNLR
ncbi:MAG: nucleoside deaminase [Bacteroidetes bacterium]|nr:nucleoside deaminase [Bacteroidota bacterium]MCK6609562.1 nucleoside deaminase [Bacteroidia bacterium]